ncbi:MAG: MAPEG family protein [Methylocystis sp.]
MTASHWLAATALLTALLPLTYVPGRIGAVGLKGAIANPTPQLAAKEPDWAQRSKAAHYNAVENLVAFATLVLIAQATGIAARPIVVFAAALYFFARLAHFIVYALGVPGLRTLTWAAGFVATLIVAWAIFAG